MRVVTLEGDDEWFDAGTFNSLLEASERIKKAEDGGLPVAYIEQIAYEKGWISKDELSKAGESMKKNSYGEHLLSLLK